MLSTVPRNSVGLFLPLPGADPVGHAFVEVSRADDSLYAFAPPKRLPHQDGIEGVVTRWSVAVFFPDQAKSALCVAGTDCGLGGRAHAALMQGVVLSEN